MNTIFEKLRILYKKTYKIKVTFIRYITNTSEKLLQPYKSITFTKIATRFFQELLGFE